MHFLLAFRRLKRIKSDKRILVMKDFLKLTVSLTMTCLIAAGALAVIFIITKEPIAKQHKLDTLKAIKLALPSYDNDPIQDKKTVTVDGESTIFYIGKKDGKITGVACETSGEGYAGMISIMVGINPEAAITGIEILSNQETPGLGTRIKGDTFRKQFTGKSFTNSKLVKGELAVSKDGGDITAITGATISSRGVTMAVNNALDIFKKNKEKIIE